MSLGIGIPAFAQAASHYRITSGGIKMKYGIMAVAFVGLVVAVAAAGPKEGKTGADQISSMAWIAGEWEGDMWGGKFRAYYCTPEGGKVMSYSKLLKDDKVAYHEFEVFELDETGNVIFRPFPGGSAKAKPLMLADCDAKERKVVFENKNKDYPTRIVYQRVADDRLVITLSDPFGESKKVETFDLRRLK
ncbi:MAG: hypothetical protein H6819_07590 [Phycisphaerales bacterium]|nr:hypothetical protein [Phycisphaerales bacterium]MCB9857643.1 hypothetical protein [Phycisphaerales bacterium]MCB9864800.1 hypothetical protein [Phycisphaerales bacterium]